MTPFPTGDRLTGPQALFRVMARFLSIEERDGIERELRRFGEMASYTLSWLPEAPAETSAPSPSP